MCHKKLRNNNSKTFSPQGNFITEITRANITVVTHLLEVQYDKDLLEFNHP